MGKISNNRNVKHQSGCYRNIKGIKYTNYADLFYEEEENKKVIEEAKSNFKYVKVLFRSNEVSADGSVFKLKGVFVSNG